MIIPEKLLDAAELIISDADVDSANLIIHCGPDGEFVGRIMHARKVLLRTERKDTLKQALYELLELCYQEIGDL